MLDTLPERPTGALTRDFIVCGWYTPDYRHWWNTLRKNLDEIGAPHDFIERRKDDGGWQVNTMRKAHEISDAMRRHPNTTIIFLDVDCTVPGGIEGLSELASIPGDVGIYLHTKWKPHGSPWIGTRTGTMVFKPTAAARLFVERWCEASLTAPRHCTDQDSVRHAFGGVPGLSVTFLDPRYCALPKDNHPAPVILHNNAPKQGKSTRLQKIIGRLAWAFHFG